ncbi:septal ring lytic transglycosylase RlpA family protein [Acidisoma sp.]|uniref:septal ring lytic transglycosylase RlpA family protein n=1 Tax=Acidisoma sp. TaxID=1872115 RepID=UPI003AFF962F
MASRLALSIAPILMFALSHQAQAQTEPHGPIHSSHHQAARLASARPGRPRFVMLGRRHNRQISFRHLAIRHVDGRQVVHSANNYGVALTNGWNPAEAGISAPPAEAPIGASVRLTSFEEPVSPEQGAAPSQSGIASYYGGRQNGRRTSSGQIFNEHAMTAAHESLPFGTKVLVKLAGTGRSVVVTITDRLYSRHRIIDLSEGAAEQLGILRDGLAMVMLTPEN